MAKVVKVIELMSQSPESWKDAAQGALNEATKHCGTFARFTPTNSPLKWTPQNYKLSDQRKDHF